MTRRTAIIQRSVPFSGHNVVDAIEMLMALGNFELPAAIFFIDDGVLQLKPNLNTENTKFKAPIKMLGALKFYDIDDIFVCKESLDIRNIEITKLPSFLKVHENHDLRELLDSYDQLVQF